MPTLLISCGLKIINGHFIIILRDTEISFKTEKERSCTSLSKCLWQYGRRVLWKV